MIAASAVRADFANARLMGVPAEYHASIGSTNDEAFRRAAKGAPEGLVVVAGRQTAGRGRQGRTWWDAPEASLLFSALLKPAIPARQFPLLSLAMACSVAEIGGAETGAAFTVKWPNDVLVDGRKVGGSLVECAARGDEVEYLIVGVGANLNVDLDALGAALGPAAAGATSLRAATGHEVDRDAFAAAYLNALDAWARCYRGEGASAVLEGWSQLDILTGRQVEIRGAGERFLGRVAGVDHAGRLIVQDAVGERRTVSSEEICVRD
jgi:BirA family transcriptional regulator, biotin operon repressor / biotin---[acetyl-CoA-carboxylase] ligase